MCGPVMMAPGGTHQIADRAVDRDRIAGWFHAAKPEVALRVGHELAPQIHRRLLGILLLVEAFGRGMPDVDLGAFDRLAFFVLPPPVYEQARPRRWRAHDRAAVLGARRVHAPERPEEIGCRLRLALVAVVEQTDQRGEAERTGH